VNFHEEDRHRWFEPDFGSGLGCHSSVSLGTRHSAKIQSLQQAHLQAISPIQQELLAKGIELQSLSLNPSTDSALITVKQKEIWDLRTKLQDMTNTLRLQIRGELTPEQQAQFDTFGPRRGMGPRMGFGPGMGPMGRW
jgi:Spy/CpxP family protein refolding chaperone